MTKRRIILWIVGIIFLIGLTVNNAICEKQQNPGDREDNLYSQIELFSDAIALIRSDYVDKIKAKDLIYGALKGMLASLDAHSQFMDPDTYKEIKVETRGEFGGIGIEITLKEGLLTIITPIDDTPGYKAGLKPGDIIVKIEDKSTRGITLIDAVKKLRGKAGTDVIITILRESEKKIFDVTITRGIIHIESIKEAYLIENNIGYVRLSEFQEGTSKDLEAALKKLEKDGMDSLILDLRNNPGGLLNMSAKVADKFIRGGRVIVTTRGRHKRNEKIYNAHDRGTHPDYPIVVLVNKGSASASEIVAGAIQDNKRGIILGTKTFGKGSVQTIVPLKDGSALRLTTAKYFTPSGRAIREEGIVPDVVVEYEERKVKKDNDRELEVFKKLEKTEKENDKIYDNQLLRAIDLLKGIKAYKRSIEG